MKVGFRLCVLLATLVPVTLRAEPQVLILESSTFGITHMMVELPARPLAVVVLLSGGDGKIGIADDGSIANPNNFLIRTRETWLIKDFGYVIIDAPQNGLSVLGRRHTKNYAALLANAVTRIAGSHVPIVLIGTSQGSIAAASAAAFLGRSVAGVVLTSTVAARGASGETVFDAALSGITVPVLIVDNAGDLCPSSPPAMAEPLALALSNAASVEKMRFSSHLATGDQCGPFSPHGYLGIEDLVLGQIRAWMARRITGL